MSNKKLGKRPRPFPEPQFLHDFLVMEPSDDESMASIRWMGLDGRGQAQVPVWLLKKIRQRGVR